MCEYYFKRICIIFCPIVLICTIILIFNSHIFVEPIPVKNIKIEESYTDKSDGRPVKVVSFTIENIKYSESYYPDSEDYGKLINDHIYLKQNIPVIVVAILLNVSLLLGFVIFLCDILGDEEYYSNSDQELINNLNIYLLFNLFLFLGYKKEILDKVYDKYTLLNDYDVCHKWYGWSYIKNNYDELLKES